MQIIVPMSGFGERFRAAGYSVPKPLIEIEGRPIIGHVIDMFPGETDFVFVCNEDHLNTPEFRMRAILEELCPTSRIVSVPGKKLGPVWATLQAENVIKRDEPVVVNYCDFTCFWDWQNFKRFVAETKCAGALPAYKGFHPHTLGTTNYAYMKESGGWMQDIQEKQPWTDNRMEEYASSGTYYFDSGQRMLDAFHATVDQDLNLNGEYYVSLAYKPLLAEQQPIAVYELQHFMQWGTPQDVDEYSNWSRAFRELLQTPPALPPVGSAVIPMAGLGSRFAKEGYTQTKPLIPVSGKSMVTQAVHDLPVAKQYSFVVRRDMPGFEAVMDELQGVYKGAVIDVIEEVTEGQACTALIGADALETALPDAHLGPVTFGACDNGALYDPQALDDLLHDESVDVIVWGARGNANAVRNPNAMGWIAADEHGAVDRISVKQPLDDPAHDPAVIGTFTFRSLEDFRRVVRHLIDRDGRVNGEFYLDSCINDAIELGLNCRLFEVDHYLNWGTPNDLKTFEYWQSCFHKWNRHPYRLEHDRRVAPESVAALEDRYRASAPIVPAAGE